MNAESLAVMTRLERADYRNEGLSLDRDEVRQLVGLVRDLSEEAERGFAPEEP